jgi:hypothetical protein
MQGQIQPGGIPRNRYRARFDALPAIIAVQCNGLGLETQSMTLPDGTAQTAARTEARDVTISIMAHHTAERLAIEAWSAARLAGAPGYKREGVVELLGAGDVVVAAWVLSGCWVKKWDLGDLTMTATEPAALEVTLSVDMVLPG